MVHYILYVLRAFSRGRNVTVQVDGPLHYVCLRTVSGGPNGIEDGP